MLEIVAYGLNCPGMTDSLSPSLFATLVFALVLVAGLLVQVWLASRQVRHVARNRHAVPAAFAQTVSLAAHQKAADYTLAKARLGLFEIALGTAVLLGWTLLGGLDALNRALLALLGDGYPMAQQLALVGAFALIGSLIDLPMELYRSFVLEARFGFNKMTPRLWLADLLKTTVLATLIGLPLVALVLWVMAATGSTWWLWVWGVFMGFNLLALVLYPTVIAPLFNKFQPLEDESLKSRVTALMQRCGFAAKGLFVMDGSKRSAHANAYFTGFGAAKRVVFYDTLLAKLSPGEVDAVLAHELGHFKYKHVVKRIVSLFVISFASLALLGWLSTQVWFFTGLGVAPNVGMASSVPQHALTLLLFMLVVPTFSFFISPLFARLSRKQEFEADAYAVAQTSGHDLSTALLKLYEDNAATLTPDPVFVSFYYSHPPASERLARMAQGAAA
jgi:STE24 endopeptidase